MNGFGWIAADGIEAIQADAIAHGEKVGRVKGAREVLSAIRTAIPFPGLVASDAEAMAYHTKLGEVWCGISKKVFEEWLSSVSKQLRDLNATANRLEAELKGKP